MKWPIMLCLVSGSAFAQEATITEKPSYEIILEQKVQMELNAELNCSIKVLDQQRQIAQMQAKINELSKK